MNGKLIHFSMYYCLVTASKQLHYPISTQFILNLPGVETVIANNKGENQTIINNYGEHPNLSVQSNKEYDNVIDQVSIQRLQQQSDLNHQIDEQASRQQEQHQQVQKSQNSQQSISHQNHSNQSSQQKNLTQIINKNQQEQISNAAQLPNQENTSQIKQLRQKQNQIVKIQSKQQISEYENQDKVDFHHPKQQLTKQKDNYQHPFINDKDQNNQNQIFHPDHIIKTQQPDNTTPKEESKHKLNQQERVHIEVQTELVVLESMNDINPIQSIKSISTQKHLIPNSNKPQNHNNKHLSKSTFQQTQPYEEFNYNNNNQHNQSPTNYPLLLQSRKQLPNDDLPPLNSSSTNQPQAKVKKMVFMQPLQAAFSRIDQSNSQYTHESLKNINQEQPIQQSYKQSAKLTQSIIQQGDSDKYKQKPLETIPSVQQYYQNQTRQSQLLQDNNNQNQAHQQEQKQKNQTPMTKLHNLLLKNQPESANKKPVVMPQSIPESVMDKLAPILQTQHQQSQQQQQKKANLQSILANLKNMNKLTYHPPILKQVIKSTQTSIQDIIIYLKQKKSTNNNIQQLDISTLKYAMKYVGKHFGSRFVIQKLFDFKSKQVCLFIDNQWRVFSYSNLSRFKNLQSLLIDNNTKQLLRQSSTTKNTKQSLSNTKLIKQIQSLILFIIQQEQENITTSSQLKQVDIIKWIQILTGLNFKKVRSKQHQLSIEDEMRLAKKIRSFFTAKMKSIVDIQNSYADDKLVLKFDENHIGIINTLQSYKSASRLAYNESETGKQPSITSFKSHPQKRQHILSYTLQSNDTIHHTQLTSSTIYLTYLTPNIKYHTLKASINTINTFELYLGNCMLVAADQDFRFILYRQTAKDKYEFLKDGKGFIKYASPKEKNVYLLIAEPLAKLKRTANNLSYESEIEIMNNRKATHKNICIRYYFKELTQDALLDKLIQCLYSGMGKNTNGGYQNEKNVYLPVQRIQPMKDKSFI